jgi:hypothetical protein
VLDANIDNFNPLLNKQLQQKGEEVKKKEQLLVSGGIGCR